MTPDEFNKQVSDIETQEPSLHKIDKKMTIIIMQQVETLSKLGNHETRLDCVEKKQIKDSGFIKGVAWIGSVIATVLGVLGLTK